MNIFSVVILMIAGIGILNLLLMAVYERTREIGLLGALGLHPSQISLLFILEGTMMGVVGVIAGIAFGLLLNGLFRAVGVDFNVVVFGHQLHGPHGWTHLSQLGVGKHHRALVNRVDYCFAGSSLSGVRGGPARAC